MPRKKKPDHKSPEYWNQLLADYGLSVDAGRDPRTIYVGSSRDLSIINDLETTRRGRPTPAKPPSR